MEEERALALLGDVAGSHRNRAEESLWLLELAAALAQTYGSERLAAFELTPSGELLGLLSAEADPLVAVLRAALGPGARPVRWACAWGPVYPGEGPAMQRTGPVFEAVREALADARASRERLVIRTGNGGADALLAGMAPALIDLLDGLTEHQRVVAGMALLDGLRQAEVADRLGIRRATTSVAFGRARVISIGRLREAMSRTCLAASAAVADAGTAEAAESETGDA